VEKWVLGGELGTGLFTVSTGRGIWAVDLRVFGVDLWVLSGSGAGLLSWDCAQAASWRAFVVPTLDAKGASRMEHPHRFGLLGGQRLAAFVVIRRDGRKFVKFPGF